MIITEDGCVVFFFTMSEAGGTVHQCIIKTYILEGKERKKKERTFYLT